MGAAVAGPAEPNAGAATGATDPPPKSSPEQDAIQHLGEAMARQDAPGLDVPVPSGAGRRACENCGADISDKHYLHQVKHIKECMGQRQAALPPGSGAKRSEPPPAPALPTTAAADLLCCSIRDWLKVGTDVLVFFVCVSTAIHLPALSKAVLSLCIPFHSCRGWTWSSI